jgi:hypothetical protein
VEICKVRSLVRLLPLPSLALAKPSGMRRQAYLKMPGLPHKKAIAHAAIGCASAAAAGGSCKAGAMSAGFSSIAGPLLPWGDAKGFNARNMIGRMIVGGIGSKLGGGKFENGALTAAMGYLFNEVAAAMKEETSTIRRKIGECRTQQCVDEYLQFARSSGNITVPKSLGSVMKDFFDTASFPARVFTPLGRSFDTAYGIAEGSYVALTEKTYGDLGAAMISTVATTSLNLSWARSMGGSIFQGATNAMESFHALFGKAVETPLKACIDGCK